VATAKQKRANESQAIAQQAAALKQAAQLSRRKEVDGYFSDLFGFGKKQMAPQAKNVPPPYDGVGAIGVFQMQIRDCVSRANNLLANVNRRVAALNEMKVQRGRFLSEANRKNLNSATIRGLEKDISADEKQIAIEKRKRVGATTYLTILGELLKTVESVNVPIQNAFDNADRKYAGAELERHQLAALNQLSTRLYGLTKGIFASLFAIWRNDAIDPFLHEYIAADPTPQARSVYGDTTLCSLDAFVSRLLLYTMVLPVKELTALFDPTSNKYVPLDGVLFDPKQNVFPTLQRISARLNTDARFLDEKTREFTLEFCSLRSRRDLRSCKKETKTRAQIEAEKRVAAERAKQNR
jgi:hypothetical protein